jgi:hypothetical protein
MTGKLIGALLLLVSLAFPMSTCSHYENAEGRRIEVAPGETPPEGAVEVVSSTYAFEDFQPLNPGYWVRALAFAWPILAIATLRWRRRGAIATGVRALEPVLIAGSIYAVHFISSFFADRREIGAYLAFLALGIYAVSTLWVDLALYREWRERRA